MQLLGEFYRDKILSLGRNKLITRELPYNHGSNKVMADLFCWRLYSGKKYIKCRSEDEALYLKVFLETGLREVKVPKDDKYLKKIMPQLLYLKRRHDEIIEDELEYINSPRIKETVRNKIWSKVLD